MTGAFNTSWVDVASYFGPNRRLSKALHLRERRRQDLSGPTPSLNVALRKLKLHVFDASPGRNAYAFAERALGAAILAADDGALDVEAQLEALARRMLAQPDKDWRATIYRDLDDLSIETYSLH